MLYISSIYSFNSNISLRNTMLKLQTSYNNNKNNNNLKRSLPFKLNMSNKVFVGNVPWDLTTSDITNMIADVVGISLDSSNIDIVTNKKGKPRGFLFITFDNEEIANDAVDAIDGLKLGERILNSNIVENKGSIAIVQKKSLNPQRSVYIKNLEYSLTEEEVWQMCDDIVGVGLVTAVKIPLDKKTYRPKGYAHAEFIDVVSQKKAIKELNGLEVFGRQLSCSSLQLPRTKVTVQDTLEDHGEDYHEYS